MLYTAIVGEAGMRTVQQVKPTQGFNCELVEQGHATLTVWDVGGAPELRDSTLKALYLKNLPFQAIIFVINVSCDLYELMKTKEHLQTLINDCKQHVEGCTTLALVYNTRPGGKLSTLSKESLDKLFSKLDFDESASFLIN